MTDSERIDFLARTDASVGKVDDLFSCLAPGYHGGVFCVVASGHAPDLRDAIDRAAERWEKYAAEQKERAA